MSDHQLESLRNKISQSHIIIDEIFELYKNITSNEAFKQIEQQLYEVNKAINNLEKINTPVPDTLREIKNQMANNIVIKTEADKILEEYRAYLSNLFNESLPGKTKNQRGGSSRLDDEASLDLVLEMITLINKNKYEFSKAAKIVADNLGVSRQSVRNKCSRNIGLQMKSFKSYALNNISQLAIHLIKRFPENESKIKSALDV